MHLHRVFALLACLPLAPIALTGCGRGSSSGSLSEALVAGAPSGLSYSDARAVYNAGRAIPPNVASVSGAGLVFTIAPSLPAGLAIDPASGEIRGTPLRSSTTRPYVVTAANALGSTSSTLRLTVVEFGLTLEPNQRGEASEVRLLGAEWGRLVDVWSREASGAEILRARDVLVGDHVGASGGLLTLATNVATGAQRLVVDAPFGSVEFANAYDVARASTIPIAPAGIGAFPPFSMVARNGAIALRFDDLVDPATIGSQTVELFTGVPAVAAFGARVLADPTHGGVADRNHDGVYETYPTRVLVDLATSDFEAAASSPPLAVNWLGLPAATSVNVANVLVRLPTVVDAPSGQVQVLENLAGNAVSFTASGPNDPTSPTLDVVRAFRSGGEAATVGDAYDGALRDDSGPRIVGLRDGAVTGVTPDLALGGSGVRIDLSYAVASCATRLFPGDTVLVGAAAAEVVETSAAPVGAALAGVRARLVTRAALSTGSAQLVARFDPTAHAGKEACFVTFAPAASSPPAAGVSPAARIVLRFDDPLDGSTVRANENVRIARTASATSASDVVPCAAESTGDARRVELAPTLPLEHTTGAAERYWAEVLATNALEGLAGGALTAGLSVPFDLAPGAPSVTSDGLVLRFASNDELFADGKTELRGSFLFDFQTTELVARPVVRFAAVADRTQPVPGLMTPFGIGAQTPLSSFGSKLQAVWRYCDVGLALLDETTYDVDVEGMAWAPVGGSVIADQFDRFEISLAHSLRLPDETVDATLLPQYPDSGLVATYASNVLDPVNDPLRTVHPGAHGHVGYTVSPSEVFLSSTGTPMVPFPLNRGIPATQYSYYTWRDTSLRARGGTAQSPGVELPIVSAATGQPHVTYYAGGAVPTFGLPLLMEFRCYPDSGALGLNAFDVSLAANSSPRPNFRAFSTGGIDANGAVVTKNPDLEPVADGGFNSGSIPPGQPTLPVDNVFHLGQLDLVTRISRVHSVWFDSGLASPSYAVPSVAPSDAAQPAGTQVIFDYRGATSVSNALLRTDASKIDAYGDKALGVPGADPVFLNGNAGWSSSLATLNGARYFQVRITLVANAATSERPSLDSVGFAWQ